MLTNRKIVNQLLAGKTIIDFPHRLPGPLATKLLSDKGAQVIKIEDEKFDCMIMDNLMPNKTGVEVLEELNKTGNGIPTIVLTADIQDTTKARCIELGAFAFLNKPIKKEELVSAVNGGLGKIVA